MAVETTDPTEVAEGNESTDDEDEESKRRLDELADEAAEESFPASDPPAVHIEEPEDPDR